MTTVFIVEDHALTRRGLRTACEQAGMRVVGEAANGIDAEEAILSSQPDVAVVDVGLPGRDGIALTASMKAALPDLGVVILTMQEDADHVFAALSAGADAYCVKASETSVVVDAVRAVAARGAYFDSRIAHLLLRKIKGDPLPADAGVLTQRELEVLALIADGLSNVEISQRLYLGMGTVKGHIHDILEKLGASDRAHAAVIAFRRGWIR